MRSALLRGGEHTLLGVVSATAEGRAAVAISRGGARKRYSYRDPNEDSAVFARGSHGLLIAVADGHGGRDAAECVLERLLEEHAGPWTNASGPTGSSEWNDAARAAIADLHGAIVARVLRGAAESARTTLCAAVVRPTDDLLAWVSIADSHVFRLTAGRVVDLTRRDPPASRFLGNPAETESSLAEHCCVGCEPLADTAALVTVTDGLSEHGIGVLDPAAAVGAAAQAARLAEPELRPLELARGVVERALEAQRRHKSGDNVATAVAWLEAARPGGSARVEARQSV